MKDNKKAYNIAKADKALAEANDTIDIDVAIRASAYAAVATADAMEYANSIAYADRYTAHMSMARYEP